MPTNDPPCIPSDAHKRNALSRSVDDPTWEPIIDFFLQDFQYMGIVGTIRLYKHSQTRRYLNVDGDTGDCFQYINGKYLPITRAQALTKLFS